MESIPIRSIPVPITRQEAPNGAVYVLTQERLLSLVQSQNEIGISTLIVDEAQGIRDGARGVLLETAIHQVLDRYTETAVFFASPLARNPEYLLSLFNREGIPSHEEHSPVSQNLILVRPGPRGTDLTSFDLLIDGELIHVDERNIDLSLSAEGVLSRRAKLAVRVADTSGCCLIYANGARDAEIIAEHVARELPELTDVDPEIAQFIEFLQLCIHPRYGLIRVLRRGVAFHYGSMPGSVRAGVEDLCISGKLKFICCTSTLLQGVNLPARDIVVENPKRGTGKAMKRADFVNLTGRAGRLLREFHGNVWCINPTTWEEQSYYGESLQNIESSFDICLQDGGSDIRRVLTNDQEMSQQDKGTAVAAISRVFTDFILSGQSLIESKYRTPENEESLRETENRLLQIETTLPAEVFKTNFGVLPTRLEALARYLRSVEDPRSLMPIAPFGPGNNARLFEIFRIVHRVLQDDPTERYRYYWRLAKEWLHQKLLREIITERLQYEQEQGTLVSTRNTIYRVIEDIEQIIRFRFARHLRAYNQVLSVVLAEKGYVTEADGLVPLHQYLECGAYDPTALSLISIGLSRTSALYLKRTVHFPRDLTPEECMSILERINLETTALPVFSRREVLQLLGS